MDDDDYRRACEEYGSDDDGCAIIGAAWAAAITLAGLIAFGLTWRLLG